MFYKKSRLTALVLASALGFNQHVGAQQDEAQSDQNLAETQAEQPQVKASTTSNARVTEGGVIQLEAVIRGNQQQPKVLTIVPWQSPERRNALPSPVWQQVRQQLQPLERRNFLQEQQLFEKLSKQ